jgi:hypothetical protein
MHGKLVDRQLVARIVLAFCIALSVFEMLRLPFQHLFCSFLKEKKIESLFSLKVFLSPVSHFIITGVFDLSMG